MAGGDASPPHLSNAAPDCKELFHRHRRPGDLAFAGGAFALTGDPGPGATVLFSGGRLLRTLLGARAPGASPSRV